VFCGTLELAKNKSIASFSIILFINQDAAIHQHKYSLAGLNGAIGSTYAVHIVLEEFS
jgi:hypothetical protein